MAAEPVATWSSQAFGCVFSWKSPLACRRQSRRQPLEPEQSTPQALATAMQVTACLWPWSLLRSWQDWSAPGTSQMQTSPLWRPAATKPSDPSCSAMAVTLSCNAQKPMQEPEDSPSTWMKEFAQSRRATANHSPQHAAASTVATRDSRGATARPGGVKLPPGAGASEGLLPPALPAVRGRAAERTTSPVSSARICRQAPE
mmetsp:Transcript_38360/g.110871  ORF Transcript_38360/g.110871 Transcript_38360/m.110871 type:complete len:201 (+) Transcript_38360:330-932(+)